MNEIIKYSRSRGTTGTAGGSGPAAPLAGFGTFVTQSQLTTLLEDYLLRQEFEELFEKVTLASGKTAIRAKFALYSNDWMSALGANPDGGTGTGGGMDETALEAYLKQYGYATQDWVRSQGYLTGHQDISHLLSKTLAAATYLSKTDAASTYLSKTDAAAQYQPKGNYLTHQAIYALTMAAGRFAAGSYNPAAGAASVNVPTHTSHLTNDSDYTTNAALNAAVSNLNKAIDNKLDRSEFEELFVKVLMSSGKTAIRAKYALYSNDWMSALGANPDGGTGTGGGMDETALEAYLTQYGYATQDWVRSQGYLTGHQDISHLLSKTLAAATYLSKTDAAQTYLSKTDAQSLYQPKGNYLTSHQALNHINYIDRRSTNLAPYVTGQYLGVEYQLKSNSADGLNDGHTLHGVLNLHAWRDSTGGAAHQMAFTDNGSVWLRHGREAWAAWRRLAFVSDIAWGNVSGKPTTLAGYGIVDAYTKEQANNRYHHTGMQSLLTAITSEVVTFDKNQIVGRPTGSTWINGFVSTHNNYLSSLIVNEHRTNDWYVGWVDSRVATPTVSWVKLLHTGNYSSTLDSRYVRKSGDTMTGALTIQTGGDTKLLFNNTDGEKYTIISFRENGTEYANIIGQADKFAFSKHIKAPYFNASETTLCSNLNADLLDGLHGSDFYRYTGLMWNADESVADFAKRACGVTCVHSSSDWAWANSANITLGSYTIDRQRYSCIDFRAGNLNNAWQQKALLFLPTYTDSHMIYIAQMSTSATAGVVTTSIKRYADYDTILASNVASATRLQGTYSLWGQSFYGNNVSGDMTGVGNISMTYGRIYWKEGRYGDQFAIAPSFSGADDSTRLDIMSAVGGIDTTPAMTAKISILGSSGNVGIGTTAPAYKLDVNGQIRAQGGWFRTTGQNGWYNETYGGGIYMQDSTWVRVYGDKAFYSGSGQIRSDLNFTREGYGGTSWDNGYGAYNVAVTNNGDQTPLLLAYRAGQQPNATGANRLFAMELLNTGTILRFSFGGTFRFQMFSDGTFYAQKGGYSDGYMSALGQNTGSDIRLKTWLADVALPLGVIASAPAWIFRWRPEVGVMAGRIDAGTTAQYWQQWLPQVVSKRKDNYLQIDYAKTALLSAIMIARHMRDFAGATDRRIMQLEATCRRQDNEIQRLNMIIKDMERRLTA